MTFNISADQLSDSLQVEVLRTIAALFPVDRYCVMGATARDLLCMMMNVGKPQRKTMDLDICIAVDDWIQFDEVSSLLNTSGFRSDGQKKHRFYYVGNTNVEYIVDVIPYGEVSKDGDYLYWPPDGDPRMSVIGFRECLRNCIIVSVDKGLFSFRIPTVPSLFLFKLDAWIDRHGWTDKDALDMMVLMTNFQSYYCTSEEYAPVYDFLEDNEYDVCIIGAAMIAYGIRKMLDDKHLLLFKSVIDEQLALAEKSFLLQQCHSFSGGLDYAVIYKSWSIISKVFGNTVNC